MNKFSKGSMKIKGIREIKSEVIVDVKCDICGKLQSLTNHEFHDFYGIHYDWGNDYEDSATDYDVCSVECFLRALGKEARELEYRESGKISNLPMWLVKELLDLLNSAKEA